MRVLEIAGLLLALLVGGVAAAWVATLPEGPADDSESARRLAPGPHAVATRDLTLVDHDRPTARNGDFAGADSRTLVVTLWYPAAADGPHPLVVYSHGFMSFRREGEYLASDLASHGYVVISADYPLTNFWAPGGPRLEDAIHQPGDVSFLIDQVLGWEADEAPFRGGIDPDHIGVVGLSLGGLTSTLVTFHPRLRDPRIAAAISIAGPLSIFEPAFFDTAAVPFLMIAGTADAMVDYEAHAQLVPERVATGRLVSIAGGTHTGFSGTAGGLMRLLGNPDAIGCRALLDHLKLQEGVNPFASLGGPADHMISQLDGPLPCQVSLPDAIPAGRQHMMTRLAATAFFERWFTPDDLARRAHREFLERDLARDFPEVSYRPGPNG